MTPPSRVGELSNTHTLFFEVKLSPVHQEARGAGRPASPGPGSSSCHLALGPWAVPPPGLIPTCEKHRRSQGGGRLGPDAWVSKTI